jgi:hypothetical protein
LLAVFTASMLVMVGLATVTAVVGRWWILAPVMVVDLGVTTAVLASVARLLNDATSAGLSATGVYDGRRSDSRSAPPSLSQRASC